MHKDRSEDIEKQRLAIFRGRKPNFFLPVPPSTQLRLRAIGQFHRGNLEAGLELLDRANEAGHFFFGTIDGREFEGWRDEDDWLGDTLELVQEDRLFWLPFMQIASLKWLVDSDSKLYRSAEIVLINREKFIGAMPICYPNSDEHPEEAVRNAEETDLYCDEAGCTRCLGLRTWLIGLDAFSPGDFRQIEKRSERIELA